MKPCKWTPAILALGLFFLAPAAHADWQPAKRLTWTPGDSFRPRAAVDSSGNLHLVWYDSLAENSEVYYSRSTDGGTTWTAKKALTVNPGVSNEPFIAVDPKDRLHVFWANNAPGNAEIYYKKSTSGGTTWSQIKRLTWTAGLSLYPVAAVDVGALNSLLLVWMDKTPGNFEIYFKKSTDGGDTWSSSKRLTWNSGASSRPVIAVSEYSNLHVVWYDDTPGASEVYYRRSTDYGVIWSPTRRLTWTAGTSLFPTIVASAIDFNLIWCDHDPGNLEIYYKKSTDGGDTWTAGKRLTWTSLDNESPSAAIDANNNLHLLWSDLTPGSYEVYYRKCTKSLGGADTWTPSKRLTWNPGESRHAVICIDPSEGLHVFWSDSTPGNFEIYYKKGN
jgi:phosphoribosyl-AMP cyclohydrolase